jgi:Icc-related predicted phosphoesterase
MNQDKDIMRIAAIGDIHIREDDKGKWREAFDSISKNADVLLITGDLTHTGDEAEATVLAEELRACLVPVIMVLGNHDFEKGRQKTIRQILVANPNVHVLDGECIVIKGVGFAGVKGFGGGFDNYMLSMFGEGEMKAFVQTAVDDSLKLERALARLDQEHDHIVKVALLHYAPISDTVSGEPKEIYPFLGSSRLAEPLLRRKVQVAFHGHAHAGTLQGSMGNIPVYNVARPVLVKEQIEAGFFIYELSKAVPNNINESN